MHLMSPSKKNEDDDSDVGFGGQRAARPTANWDRPADVQKEDNTTDGANRKSVNPTNDNEDPLIPKA